MSQYAVVVHDCGPDRWGYVARVVRGTKKSYYPDAVATVRRPTAGWARRAGERSLRRVERRLTRADYKRRSASRVNGYTT